MDILDGQEVQLSRLLRHHDAVRDMLIKRGWRPSFDCAARAANHGAGDPPECDWPVCGCDAYADKVIEALQERGDLK